MLEPGQIFAGRYCIRRLIGSGAKAEVYEARHAVTDHAVAVKLLRSPDPGAAARNFATEARIDARVGSPHIVHVQDAGVDEASGFPYLVLELLQGKTFAQLLKEQPEGRARVDQTREVLRQVALGLDTAHAYGVVHRNLVPKNIFLTDQSLVKIMDFGLAKVLDTSGQVTQQLRGTPYYMAPEQANCEPVSPQTDIWALGLVAYRALTGRIYWRCANRSSRGARPASEHAASLGEIMCEICLPRHDPPSVRMREDGLQLQLPEGFDDWLLRCLEREPPRRFASAGEAVAELRRVLASGDAGVLPGPSELTLASPAAPARPTATLPAPVEQRGPAESKMPDTPRPTGVLRRWRAVWVAAALGLLLASAFYPLRQPSASAPAAAVAEVASHALAPAERAAAEGATQQLAPTPASVEAAVTPVAAVAASAVAASAVVEQPGTVKIAPITALPQADAPPVLESPPAKKRPRAAAAKRARAAAAKRARTGAAQRARAGAAQRARLTDELGLSSKAAEQKRPPPTELSD